jgi:hypothetical protein
MPTLTVERSLAALREDLQLWFREHVNYQKALADQEEGLRAAAWRFLCPDADRTPSDVEIGGCIVQHRNALLAQLPPAEVEAFDRQRDRIEGLKSAIAEHGARVAEYAERRGIDAGPLREFLRSWAAEARLAVLALIEHISEQVRNDPDTVVCNALTVCLSNVEQLHVLAKRATDLIADESWKGEQAQESYRQLTAQLETVRNTPRRDEWAHLESWKLLEGVVGMLRRVAGVKDVWATVWGRLRQELLASGTRPDFDHLREEVQANLSRLRDQGTPLPPIPVLPEQTTPAFDPTIQAILDHARTKQRQAVELQRAHAEAESRLHRVHQAWLRVCQFRGDAIPNDLTGESLHRRYAELIVDLGQVLTADGWQDRVDTVQAGTGPKVYALAILRKAMERDTVTVTKMLREGLFGGGTPMQFGWEADRWLREGLMYEVLGIQPAPEPPLGWEGPYTEPVETVGDFIQWINREFVIHEIVHRGKGSSPSDGRSVRNAFRLVMKLELAEMPLEPTGPFTLNDELAVMRNLRRLCSERQADGESGKAVGQTEGTQAPPAPTADPKGKGEIQESPNDQAQREEPRSEVDRTAAAPDDSPLPPELRGKIGEIRRAATELWNVAHEWAIWAGTAGQRIEGLPVYGDEVHTPPDAIAGMRKAIELKNRVGLALRTLYGHRCLPPSLRGRPLEEALSLFPSYPEGAIDSQRDKQFVSSVRQALPALRELDAELSDWLDQLATAPLSVINALVTPPATGEADHPSLRASRDEARALASRREANRQAQAPAQRVRSLRDQLRLYGHSPQTRETATLVGLAELIGEFMRAVRADGWGDRFERLKAQHCIEWDAAFEIIRRCEQGDFGGAAALMEQCEKDAAAATTDEAKRLYWGVMYALLNTIPNAIVVEPEPAEPPTSTPANPPATKETEQVEVTGGAGLSPSRRKAYQQHQWAVESNVELEGTTDRQVYDWLGEHLDENEQLPPFSTWSRYLRDARASYGTSKHTPRAGRKAGRSIVRPDEI